MSALSGQQMVALGIVGGLSPDGQQANGCDLSVAEVERIVGAGALYKDDKTLPDYEPMPKKFAAGHGQRVWFLTPGAYVIRFAETVRLPMDAMGYLHPRSTLVRIGASLHTGVVDAGYQGKMQCGLVVHNPKGILLAVGARVAQFTVHRMEQAVATGYAGQYMGEGLTDSKPWSVCPKCGKASDLEGNALCATCDFGEDDPPGRPWPPQPEEPEINPKLRVRHR